MNSLEPFIRHELENQSGTTAAPQANSTRIAPPLGSMPLQPPAAPDTPGTQLPPPELPQPEKPGVPMTDGTPVACRQKNAAAFLAGADQRDGTLRAGAVQHKAEAAQPPPCPGRGRRRRFGAGGMARGRPLRLSVTKIF